MERELTGALFMVKVATRDSESTLVNTNSSVFVEENNRFTGNTAAPRRPIRLPRIDKTLLANILK